jgi:hypothetical protein
MLILKIIFKKLKKKHYVNTFLNKKHFKPLPQSQTNHYKLKKKGIKCSIQIKMNNIYWNYYWIKCKKKNKI